MKSFFKKSFDPGDLIEKLGKEDSNAIQFILSQVEKPAHNILMQMGFTTADIEEMVHDAIMIFIKKIQNQSYILKAASPNSYLIGICKYLALNKLKTKKIRQTSALSEDNYQLSEELVDLNEKLARFKLLEQMLDEMGEPCNTVIRQKYIEERTDEEQLRLKLTKYTNPESLRVTRSQCMKKLSVLALKYKSVYASI